MKLLNVRLATIAFGAAVSAVSMAGLTPYSQNFEGLNMGSGSALGDDGWKVFANVFNGSGGYLYGYGPFPAPNGTGGFSAIATGEGGTAQGQQYLNTFSDYLNGDHNNPDRIIESNVFQEQTVSSADLGKNFTFTFDYKASSQNGPAGPSTAQAFVKVLNPSAGWALVAFPTFVTTNASTTAWGTQTISISIDNAWNNHVLQFGFMNTSRQFSPTGVFYDNINFSEAVPEPASMTMLALGLAGIAARRRRK